MVQVIRMLLDGKLRHSLSISQNYPTACQRPATSSLDAIRIERIDGYPHLAALEKPLRVIMS